MTGVNLPVPHRGPKLGGRGVLGSPQSPAQLWLPLHPAAGMTLSGRSALPRTPWLLTQKVRSPGGSPQPTPAPRSGLPPLSPHWSPQSQPSPYSETLALGSFRPEAQGRPFLRSPEGPVHPPLCPGPHSASRLNRIPSAKGLLVVGSKASAGSARGLLKLHCLDEAPPPCNWLLSPEEVLSACLHASLS